MDPNVVCFAKQHSCPYSACLLQLQNKNIPNHSFTRSISFAVSSYWIVLLIDVVRYTHELFVIGQSVTIHRMFVHVSQIYHTIVWLISCRNIIHTESRSFFSIIFSYLQCISLNFTLASLTLMKCFWLNHLCLENLFFYVQNTFLHNILAFIYNSQTCDRTHTLRMIITKTHIRLSVAT